MTAWLLASGCVDQNALWRTVQPTDDNRKSRRVLAYIALKRNLLPQITDTWLYTRIRDTLVDAVQQREDRLLTNLDPAARIDLSVIVKQLQDGGNLREADELSQMCTEKPNSSALSAVMNFFT